MCDQEYVRVSSASVSEAVPSRLTVEPSAASWSCPALTVGAVFALSVMVTSIVSEAGAVPSSTVRVNSIMVSEPTLGAVKDVSSAALLPSVMVEVELCDQEYVRVSSASVSEAVPSRLTVEPSVVVWSGPGVDRRGRVCAVRDGD